ncbi:hypothetical protein [Bacillus sp. Marseille-Q1617]|uniref:hypothetical protein n=1 Tax=Bacillus sp. Marseille-Q1617 TaxID=2736887 RepID=UPI0015884DF8|nr:hypothetical protein [Bacillus sp. Marseille-Q1617]
MQKRLIGALLFIGVLAVPTFASAEGGLLSNVTDEVDAVTDEVISTEDKASREAPAPDEEEDKPGEGNILSSTIDSVKDTVDQTTGTVKNTVDTTVSEAGDAVNRTVDTAVEPVSRLTGDSAAPVTDTVKESTKSVTNTVEHTTKTVTGTVEDTAETVTETVDDTTKPVTESLSDDEPLVEVDVEEPEVKVETGIIEADVSDEPSVNVETEDPDRIQDSPNTTVIPESQESKKDAPDKENKGTSELSTETRMNKAKQIEESITAAATGTASPEKKPVNTGAVEGQAEESKNDLPPIPYKQMEPVLTNSTTNTTNGHSTITNGMGQSPAAGNLQAFREREADNVSLERSGFNGKENLYYDQWLNAPPSQPPQHSLLFKSI